MGPVVAQGLLGYKMHSGSCGTKGTAVKYTESMRGFRENPTHGYTALHSVHYIPIKLHLDAPGNGYQ